MLGNEFAATATQLGHYDEVAGIKCGQFLVKPRAPKRPHYGAQRVGSVSASSDGVLQKENISAHVPMPAMRAAGQSATQGVSIIAGFCHLCDIPSSAQHSTAQGMRRGEDAGTVKLDAATGSDIYWLHDAATLLRYSSRGADDLLV